MRLQQVLGANLLTTGTSESINLLEFLVLIAASGLLAQLLRADTAAMGYVKLQRCGARHFKSSTLVAVDVLVADGGVVKVEDAVGSLATRINSGGTFLHQETISALHIVRQHTFLAVGDRKVKEEALGTKNRFGGVFAANIILVTLLGIGEAAVHLRTPIVRRGEPDGAVVLAVDHDRCAEQKFNNHLTQHSG